MYKMKQSLAVAVVLALVGLVIPTQAQWTRWARRDDRQMRELLTRIEQNAVRFQNSAQQFVNQSRYDETRKEERFDRLMTNFQQSLAQLRDRFNRRQVTDADVQQVLDRAARIDGFVYRRQLGARAESDWRDLRSDLDRLASLHNIAWNWDRVDQRGGVRAALLSGTFRLNTAESDDARLIVERAVRSLPYSNRQRASEMLLRRMEAPEQLAIDRRVA